MKNFVFGSLFISTSLLAAPVSAPNSTMSPTTLLDNSKGNDIEVQAPKDRFTSTEDHKLGSQIRVQIAEIIGAPKADAIILIVDEGDVKLIGKVSNDETRKKITEAVHQLKGVKSIHNKLETEKNGNGKKGNNGTSSR